MAAARSAAVSRPASFIILAAFFWITAAAGHAGFMGKWAFRDHEHNPTYDIEAMLDGTAKKPFVYRQLLPGLANITDWMLSNSARQNIEAIFVSGFTNSAIKELSPEATFAKAASASHLKYHFRYMILYYASFLSLFGSLFVFRRILLDLRASQIASVLAPASLILTLPYIQTVGGFFYDNAELLFLGLGFLAALRGWITALLIVTLLGTLNKETFLFFVPALYPLLSQHYPRRQALIVTVLAFGVAAFANIAIKLIFWHNAGEAAEWHAIINLREYSSFWTYHRFEVTYGIIGPMGVFPGTILLATLLVLRGWPYCSKVVRQHIAIAALLNLPLFFLFAKVGEMRNLSLLLPGLLAIVAGAITGVERRTALRAISPSVSDRRVPQAVQKLG